jgi:hypothetical protein
MQGFTPLAEVSSNATRSVELRRLTDRQTRVLQCFMEEVGNVKVPKLVEMQKMAWRLRMSYKAIRNAKNALVKKGFLEQWTTTFRDKDGLFRKATYYRIKF